MTITRLRIGGIYTLQDAANVLRALSALPTIKEAEVSDGLARIYHGDLASRQILNAIHGAGDCCAEIISIKNGRT